MKKLFVCLLALALLTTMTFILASCSGGSDTATEAPAEATTEAPADAATEAPTEAVTEAAGDENPGAKYLPLTNDNVLSYVEDVYGYDYFDMDNIVVGSGENNTVHIKFLKDEKYYYYVFDKETGEAVKTYEAVDELPDEATQPAKTTSDYAVDACRLLLPGFVEGGQEWPDDIHLKKTKENGKQIIYVDMTWRGESYQFMYDVETETATQLKP